MNTNVFVWACPSNIFIFLLCFEFFSMICVLRILYNLHIVLWTGGEPSWLNLFRRSLSPTALINCTISNIQITSPHHHIVEAIIVAQLNADVLPAVGSPLSGRPVWLLSSCHCWSLKLERRLEDTFTWTVTNFRESYITWSLYSPEPSPFGWGQTARFEDRRGKIEAWKPQLGS